MRKVAAPPEKKIASVAFGDPVADAVWMEVEIVGAGNRVIVTPPPGGAVAARVSVRSSRVSDDRNY